MSLSLREQLLQAGLGTKKQAKEAERQDAQRARHRPSDSERRKQDQQREERRKQEQQRAAQAQAAKAAREEEQRRKRQEEADRKARWAQIKQLIEQHRQPKVESDEYFNFISRGKVRRLAVDGPLRAKIVRGDLVIVRCEGKHDVVSREIGESIRNLDARAVIALDSSGSSPAAAEDDPYKDYVVPDDLMW